MTFGRRALVGAGLAACALLLTGCLGATAGSGCNRQARADIEEGLAYVDLHCGTGTEVTSGVTINVTYTGRLRDGTVFDSSGRRKGQPLSVKVGIGQVIPGVDKGVVGMRAGGTRRLVIEPGLAYGRQGYPGLVPPQETVVYDVTVRSVDQGG